MPFPSTTQTECGGISPQENYVFWNVAAATEKAVACSDTTLAIVVELTPEAQ
jgi:hypothetical protein